MSPHLGVQVPPGPLTYRPTSSPWHLCRTAFRRSSGSIWLWAGDITRWLLHGEFPSTLTHWPAWTQYIHNIMNETNGLFLVAQYGFQISHTFTSYSHAISNLALTERVKNWYLFSIVTCNITITTVPHTFTQKILSLTICQPQIWTFHMSTSYRGCLPFPTISHWFLKFIPCLSPVLLVLTLLFQSSGFELPEHPSHHNSSAEP